MRRRLSSSIFSRVFFAIAAKRLHRAHAEKIERGA
jgi:hypothetical protein